jgi:hypothetical protein
MTTRDDVWTEALDVLAEEGAFRTGELPFAEEQYYTVRRTLREMERLDWLWRTSPYSPTWRAGPKARETLELTDLALDASDPERVESTDGGSVGVESAE